MLNQYQKANFLSTVGEKTPVFVRFSTVTLGREYPDEARNPRGFAIKMYTKEGNYDVVGLNFVSSIELIIRPLSPRH
jgi:catalase